MTGLKTFLVKHRFSILVIGAGLSIRLLLMPFSFHRDDVIQIAIAGDSFYKFGFQSVNLETLNYIFPPYFYPLWGWIIFPFINLFCDPLVWLKGELLFNPIHSSWALEHYHHLFRFLFFYKLYMIPCDLIILLFLIKTTVVLNDKKITLAVLILWLFNPVTLQSQYAHGGWDMLPLLLVFFSLWLFIKGKPFPGMFFIGLSAGTKLIPIFLLPLLAVYAGRTFKKKLSALLFGFLVLAAGYVALFSLAGLPLSFESLFAASGEMVVSKDFNWMRFVQKALCVSLMGIFLLFVYGYQKKHPWMAERNAFQLSNSVLALLLVLFAFVPLGFRHYMWLTPFLILYYAQNRNVLPLIGIQLLLICVLQVFPQKSIQLQLLAPLAPDYFNRLPFAGQLIDRIIPMKSLLMASYRVFIVVSLLILFHLIHDTYFTKKLWTKAFLVYRYSFLLIFFFLTGVTALGFLSGRNKGDLAGYAIKYGFSEKPALFSDPFGEGKVISQTMLVLDDRLPAVKIFLKADRPELVDSIEVRLITQECREKRGYVSPGRFMNNEYNLFELKGADPAENSEVKLLLTSEKTTLGAGLKAGLFRSEINYSDNSFFKVPSFRKDNGQLEYLKKPLNVNYALTSEGIDPGRQLAFSVQKIIPLKYNELFIYTLKRLKTDIPFMKYYGFFWAGLLIIWISSLIIGYCFSSPNE